MNIESQTNFIQKGKTIATIYNQIVEFVFMNPAVPLSPLHIYDTLKSVEFYPNIPLIGFSLQKLSLARTGRVISRDC